MSKNFIWSPDNPEGTLVDLTAEEQAEIDAMVAAKPPATPEWELDRKANYPSIGDQLDALFHAGVFPADMASKIQSVKDKFPKDAE